MGRARDVVLHRGDIFVMGASGLIGPFYRQEVQGKKAVSCGQGKEAWKDEGP